MSFWFLKNEEEEKKRNQRGGFGNRVLGFLDDLVDADTTAQRTGRDLVVGAARGVARTPEKAVRSSIEAGGDIAKKIAFLTADEERRKELEARDKAQEFDAAGPTDPVRRLLYGSEPVQTYQTAAEGNEALLEKSRFRDYASPLAAVGGIASVGLDAPTGGSQIIKGFGKEVAEKLAKETTEAGVKNIIKKELPEISDDLLEKVAPAIAKTQDKGVISNLLQDGKSQAQRLQEVATPKVDVPVERLTSYEGAPDRARVELYKRRIQNGEDVAPLKVLPDSKGNMGVEDGKHRLQAMKELGIETAPVEDTYDVRRLTTAVQPPGERQYGLLKTAQSSEQLPEETKQAVGAIQPQTYRQMNIEDTIEAARKTTAKNYDEAKRIAEEGLNAGKWDDQTSSHTIALLEKASSEGRIGDLEELMSKASEAAKSSGQANVLWRTLANKNTPEGMVKLAEKVVENANDKAGFLTKTFRKVGNKGVYTLDDDAKAFIRTKMAEVQKMPDGEAKDAALKEVMERINEAVPPGASEMFDAFRYQNLLSSPRTQARNTMSNLFQTMITRPTTLATRGGIDWFGATLFGKERQNYLKEVPEYYRGLFNSIGDATEAFKGAWKGTIDIAQPDLRNVVALRNKNMPKALTAVSRFMEAQDRFLQTMVASGEYAAMKSKGVTDDVARAEAEKVAQYSLFRDILDPKNKRGQGELLSAIDKFSDTVTTFGQKHKSFKWFVPFVRTPMNVTKQMIEYSPAGLATLKGSTRKPEQVSKALIGSMIMLTGAKMALDGDVTWDVPKDASQRELFYSQGKKPYSVKVGDSWVPLIYFGPLSLAFGIPAAFKDAHDEAPLDANEMEKVVSSLGNTTKFLSQQTYVQGMANFMDVLSGEADASLLNSLGFTAGQAMPLQGLQRYVAGVVDPIFRKKKGFMDSIKADIPFASKSLEAYEDPFTGEPSKRNITDYTLPYSLGRTGDTKEIKGQKEMLSDFYAAKKKVSPLRTKASEEVNEAIEAGDMTKARAIAEEHNSQVVEAFKKWSEKYKESIDNPALTQMYNEQKINLSRRSVSSRRRSLKERVDKRRLLNG